MKERPTVGAALESSTQEKVAQTFFPSGEKEKTRKVENIKSIKPESDKTKKVENQKSIRVGNHYNFSVGKTQVSFWLPDEVVEDLKIQAAKEKKRMSRIVTDVLVKSLKTV